MNIGEAADRSGLPEKTIRYYETIGLIKPRRQANGFRDYGEREVQLLRLIGRARGIGFSVEECRSMIGLFSARRRPADSIDEAVARHLRALGQKRQELRSLEIALEKLVESHRAGSGVQLPSIDDVPDEFPVSEGSEVRRGTPRGRT